MKKLFTLALALLASFSLWAVDYYTPTADEVIILNDVYDKNATEAGYSTHAAIAWGGTVSFSDKKAGDPNNNGEATSSNVKTCSVKGNGSGKDLTVSFEGCSQIIVYHEKQSSRYVELRAGSKTGDLLGKSVGNTYFTAVDLNANNSYSIFLHGVKDNGDDQDFYIYAVKLIKGETCDDPEAHLAFTKSIAFVGEQFSYDFGSKNGGALTTTYTLNDAPAEQGTDYTFSSGNLTVLKAGQFVMRMTIDAQDGYCAVDVSDTILINEATPVASVTIAGPTAGYAGYTLTYTAEAENATTYEWYVDGVAANNNSATFNYTAVKGNHAIKATATNKFTTTPVESNTINVAVTKLCGELIRATRNGKNIDPVTGIIGGTAAKNTQDDGKLGKDGHYWKLTLASGNFMIGDTVIVNVSAAAQQGVIAITSDQAATNLLGATEDVGVVGDNKIVLTKGGVNTIWFVRVDASNKWNGYVDAISVTRPCEDSKDASIKSLTINGVEVEENEGVFAYTVSATENLAQVAVAYTIHPLATATPASGFNVDVPTAGNPANTQVITVTAEDGETKKEYTVSVAKAATLNDDATLKALAVEGYTLDPAFNAEVTAYTITKAYGAENPAKNAVTATPNDANANAEVVRVDDVFTITVTAEDNTTTKVYTITILEADAPRKLNEIIFSNSYKGYLLNGQGTDVYGFYLEGKDAPTVQSCIVSEGATWAVVGNTLTVTGADSKFTDYTINIEAVSPMEYTDDVVTLNGTESWVKGAYGFNESKGGWLFSKTDDDFSREIAGKTHVELFLPATQSVLLKAGANGTVREVDIRINGVLKWEKKELTKEGGILVSGDDTHAFMLSIVSHQTGGDGGLGSIQLTTGHPTGMDNTDAANKAIKAIENGQIVIIKNGVRYNVLGAVLK